MEKLTPVQRVTVIAIGLALTLLVLVLLLPWAWKQILEWLPATPTRSVGLVPAPLSQELMPAAERLAALGLAAVLPGGS